MSAQGRSSEAIRADLATFHDPGTDDDAADAAMERLARDVMRLLAERDELRAEVARLRQAVECEREDCRQIASTASDVYCDITGGLLSYPTYDARTILAAANDYTQKLIDEETAELRAALAAVPQDTG